MSLDVSSFAQKNATQYNRKCSLSVGWQYVGVEVELCGCNDVTFDLSIYRRDLVDTVGISVRVYATVVGFWC
jgi:hypothetical protein